MQYLYIYSICVCASARTYTRVKLYKRFSKLFFRKNRMSEEREWTRRGEREKRRREREKRRRERMLSGGAATLNCSTETEACRKTSEGKKRSPAHFASSWNRTALLTLTLTLTLPLLQVLLPHICKIPMFSLQGKEALMKDGGF